MPFGKNTHTFSLGFLVLAVVILPMTALAVVSDTDLEDAKQAFDQAWHAAADTTQRRAQLEETLAQFDTKVATAKQNLADAADRRRDLRQQIDEHQALVEALRGQIDAAVKTRAFYESVAASRSEDFAEFIRFLISRDIADRESGPSFGGPLMKSVLKRSLGESIDRQMAEQAVLTARRVFFSQVDTLLAESDRVNEELHASAEDLSRELTSLEKQYGSISSLVEETGKFIDESWKIRKLTEDEIAEVAAEAAESQAKIADVQTVLLQVNEELKQAKMGSLRGEIAVLQKQQAEAEAERDAAVRKDQAMKLLQDQALRALQEAMQAKNTDKKLYKHIEELELERNNFVEGVTTSGGTGALLAPDVAAKIDFFDRTLALMRTGVPRDAAERSVQADVSAAQATVVRAELRNRIAELSAAAAAVQKQVSEKVAEADGIERQFSLTGLPPLFQWPVGGIVTAGYLDPDYVSVFRVPHRGMDIAVPQSSPIRAAGDGVVFAVKDGGLTGYSYVIIAHRQGYASLYGHISTALVKAGDTVSAGQVIALSGGTPGTHGAGPMTTGAHVHLEMTLNGQHIDPRSVLPPR